MSEALPQSFPPAPEPWSSWRKDQLLEEVNALMIDAGLLRSVSTSIRGKSGVLHNFTQSYFDGEQQLVVDVYDRATAVEVIQTFIKSLDTKSKARIVSADEPTAFAIELSGKYGLALDTALDVDDMYNALLTRTNTVH